MHKNFSESTWKQIKDTLNSLDSGPHYAAFDADGTLWDADMGESFFQYQQDGKWLDLPEDPWAHYDKLKSEKHPTIAYLWLAQVCAGQKETTILQQSADHVSANHPISIFEDQRKLIDLLRDHGVNVFVVTASIKWAVIPAAERYFQIPPENVIGIEVEVDENGFMTEKQKGDITWREGKKTRLLEATNGVRPILCSGNTIGDQHLLEASCGIRLAVSSVPETNRFYDEELGLIEIAKEREWLMHRF